MKKIFVFYLALILTIPSCDVLHQTMNEMSGEGGGLTNSEVISGLKEALTLGINNSSSLASKVDGFNKNSLIRIPFPQEAIVVKEKLTDIGFTQPIDKFEETLNRAAEEASKKAAPIFINAITNMTIEDGFKILNGEKNSATEFLKNATTSQLTEAFSPEVEKAIQEVELTKYWKPVIDKYNVVTLLTGGEKINPDLNSYVTGKAIDGLFTLVSQEEEKIRENPAARATDLLKKVFGSLDK